MNVFQSILLLTALTALLSLGGYAFAGPAGFVAGLVLAAVLDLGAYWFSSRLVLRMYEARPLGLWEAPTFHQIVRRVCLRARVPMPRLFVVPEAAPNAFSTGRGPLHAAMAVTEGLLEQLTPAQLEAVAAHELAHIRRRDTLLGSIVAALAGAIGSVMHFVLWGTALGRSDSVRTPGVQTLPGLLFAPVMAAVVQFAMSPAREFEADDMACRFTGNPEALAEALERIGGWAAPPGTGSPASSHLLIVNPFPAAGMLKLFNTHPPLAERIRRLRTMTPPRKQAA